MCLHPLQGLSEKPCEWTLRRNSINTEASDSAAEMLFLTQEAFGQETEALEKVLTGIQDRHFPKYLVLVRPRGAQNFTGVSFLQLSRAGNPSA